jgi:hypothetical protein
MSSEGKRQGKNISSQCVTALVKASSQARKEVLIWNARSRNARSRCLQVFTDAKNSSCRHFMQSCCPAVDANGGKNKEDRNVGHLSKAGAEAKNYRNVESREDRSPFGHVQWHQVARPAHIGASCSMAALTPKPSFVLSSGRKAEPDEPKYACIIDRRFTEIEL